LEAIKEEDDENLQRDSNKGINTMVGVSVPDISMPDKSGDKTGDTANDVTMGLAGDISDIQPDNPPNQNNPGARGTPGFKNKDFINFYEGNSEDMSMLKDMTSNPNDQSKET